MRAGDPKVPIIYEVDRIRDGSSFTTRRVVGIQHGHAIFSLEASFQIEEAGLEHQKPKPLDVTRTGASDQRQGPERAVSAECARRHIRKYWEQDRPIEMKPLSLTHYFSREKLPPEQNVWIKTTGPVPDDRAVQAAVLAYLSDMTLLDTSLYAHGRSIFDRDLQVASLDHAMWFHRPCRFDDWLLYTADSPSTSGARGFNRGAIYSRDGTLIASTAQEGLIRVHPGDDILISDLQLPIF